MKVVLKKNFNVPSGSSTLNAKQLLVSFILSFASRVPSRDRLHIFTTNYDRLLERIADLVGLRIVDRFVGALEPEFRSSRLQIGMHYMPLGVRGEPRHLEGVVQLTKLHGSLDWRYKDRRLWKCPIAFGSQSALSEQIGNPIESLMIYPNSTKDMDTVSYPYSELFRDFSAAICRPNSVLVTYGYGFGDEHVNRVIADMLTIPSTHLVIIARDQKPHERVKAFIDRVGHLNQMTLMLGTHYADLNELVAQYLPKPAIDPINIRMNEIQKNRGETEKPSETEIPSETEKPNELENSI